MPRYWTFAQRIFSPSAGVRPWNALVTHQSAIDAISHMNAVAPGAEARRCTSAPSHSATAALTRRMSGTGAIIPPLDADDASKPGEQRRFRRTGNHRLDEAHRLGDGRNRFDAEPLRARRKQLDRVAPDEQRSRP